MADYLTIETLADEVRPLFGQVVLVYGSDLAVLHGVGWTEDDLYYICRPKGYHAKPIWYSAVGHCEGLKAHLPPEMYGRMENLFKLNGPMPERFEMKVQIDGAEAEDYDPDKHPALMLAAQKAAHEAAVANAEDLDDVLTHILDDESAS